LKYPVLPYKNDEYHKLRQTLSLKSNEIVKINDDIAFNIRMQEMKKLYEDGNLAVIQGVGYPNPNRSHFRSMEIWHTAADSDEYLNEGWLGKYFKNTGVNEIDPKIGISLDGQISQAMHNLEGHGVTYEVTGGGRGGRNRFRMDMNRSDDNSHGKMKIVKPANNLDFLRMTRTNASTSFAEIKQAADNYTSKTEYPNTAIARKLNIIASCIAADFPTKVYYTSLGGFDTHANQKNQHLNLTEQYSKAVYAFQDDLKQQGFSDKILTLTFSEFGRRVAENGSRGTDHGTAAPMFVMGSKVNPGIFGHHPSLTDLDNGDLKYHTDFRSVYSTVLDKWLQVEPQIILGKKFDNIAVL